MYITICGKNLYAIISHTFIALFESLSYFNIKTNYRALFKFARIRSAWAKPIHP